MKKCVIVSDSFKGSLSSLEIGRIAKAVFQRFFPQCQAVSIPVADGGEGTVTCFSEALHAPLVNVSVHGPFNEKIDAAYCRFGENAVIEMAAAAGLPLTEKKDPSVASTYGVGELILHAVKNGAKRILLGLGGSATNDAGCGCAAALGVRFYDKTGALFVPVGATLSRIKRIDVSQAQALLSGIDITAMCDVENPLFGENGAAYIFAPQKGADKDMVEMLDGELRHFDKTLQEQLQISVADTPGSGAAGGMGAGCVAFLNATLKPGIHAILDLVNFDAEIAHADLIITGEGRVDAQSAQGKVISGVAERAQKVGVPLLVIAGSVMDDADALYDMGVSAMFSISREAKDFEKCQEKAADNYRRTLEDILRLFAARKK